MRHPCPQGTERHAHRWHTLTRRPFAPGVLSLDCALFLWDQCVLLGWAEVLSRYAATSLLALRRDIKAASTVRWEAAAGPENRFHPRTSRNVIFHTHARTPTR